MHIRDIAAAALAVLAAPLEVVLGQAFNIGRNVVDYRIRELAERIPAVYSRSHLTFGLPSGDNRSYRVDFTKVQTGLPGFSPQWDLVRGLRECCTAFGEIGLDTATFGTAVTAGSSRSATCSSRA